MFTTAVIVGRSCEGVSKPDKESAAHFFSLFVLTLVLIPHTIQCKVTFTCMLSDPREEIGIIPMVTKKSHQVTNWSQTHTAFLCLSQRAFRAALSLTLAPHTVISVQRVPGGCLELPLTGLAELWFCSFLHGKVTVPSLRVETSAVDVCGEHILWMGGKMSPTSDTLLEYLRGKEYLSGMATPKFSYYLFGSLF